MRITDYILAYGDSMDELLVMVGDRLKEGWQPIGGVCAVPETEGGSFYMYQAMVKYAEKSQVTKG